MYDRELISWFEQKLAAMDRAGVRWCVLRNYERFPYPRSDSSDLDILVEGRVGEIVKEFLAGGEKGRPAPRLVRYRETTDRAIRSMWWVLDVGPPLRVDLFERVSWRGYRLVDEAEILFGRVRLSSGYGPKLGHEAAVSLLGYCFHQGVVKNEYREAIRSSVSVARAEFEICLRPVWGARRASDLSERILDGDWGGCASWVAESKRILLIRGLLQPFNVFRAMLTATKVIVSRLVARSGLCIAFIGPDGAGKTTIIDLLRKRMESIFPERTQRHFHWRPRVLPNPGALLGKPEPSVSNQLPHARSSRGRLSSILRLFYFLVDYAIGRLARVLPALVRGGLVTFDRYAYDFEIDPVRYRLALPNWIGRLAWRCASSPDLVFVLVGDPAVLHSRKKELTVDEIAEQIESLKTISPLIKRSLLVEVCRPVDETVREIESATKDYLDRRNRARCKASLS